MATNSRPGSSPPARGERDRVRDTLAMPQGFFGVGLDIELARKTHVGASFRTLAMRNFSYQRADLDQRDTWGFIGSLIRRKACSRARSPCRLCVTGAHPRRTRAAAFHPQPDRS